MLSELEQISIYLFFILHLILESYQAWQIQMNGLAGNNEVENVPMRILSFEKTPLESLQPVEIVLYTESQIGIEHDDFFSELTNSLMDDPYCTELGNSPYITEEDDILHMDAWWDEPEPVTVTSQLSSSATARIKDYEMGKQLWVVEVVGEEQGYLHVSDGTGRAWVNTEEFGEFLRGDILSLLVERKNDQQILAQAVDILQRRSTEFIIPDEGYWTEETEVETA